MMAILRMRLYSRLPFQHVIRTAPNNTLETLDRNPRDGDQLAVMAATSATGSPVVVPRGFIGYSQNGSVTTSLPMLLLLALTVIHVFFDKSPSPQRRKSPYFFL